MTTKTTTNPILSKTPVIYVTGRYSATKVTLSQCEEGLYVVPNTWVFASESIKDDTGVVIYSRPRSEKKGSQHQKAHNHKPKKAKPKREPSKTRVVEISFEG